MITDVLTISISQKDATILGCEKSWPGVFQIPSRVKNLPVTKIAANAFKGTEFKAIHIPDSVCIVKDNAFAQCENLETISLSKNIVYLPKGFVKDCVRLKRIHYGYNLRVIDDGAFENCASIENFWFDRALTKIGKRAFKNCLNLTTAVLGENVKEVGQEAFCGCKKLVGVSFSGKGIEERTFSGCSSLTDCFIHEGVKKICPLAFEKCFRLNELLLPLSVNKVSFAAFKGCGTVKIQGNNNFKVVKDWR